MRPEDGGLCRSDWWYQISSWEWWLRESWGWVLADKKERQISRRVIGKEQSGWNLADHWAFCFCSSILCVTFSQHPDPGGAHLRASKNFVPIGPSQSDSFSNPKGGSPPVPPAQASTFGLLMGLPDTSPLSNMPLSWATCFSSMCNAPRALRSVLFYFYLLLNNCQCLKIKRFHVKHRFLSLLKNKLVRLGATTEWCQEQLHKLGREHASNWLSPCVWSVISSILPTGFSFLCCRPLSWRLSVSSLSCCPDFYIVIVCLLHFNS